MRLNNIIKYFNGLDYKFILNEDSIKIKIDNYKSVEYQQIFNKNFSIFNKPRNVCIYTFYKYTFYLYSII